MQSFWATPRPDAARYTAPRLSQTPVIDRMLLLGPQHIGQSRLELLPVELIWWIIPYLPVDARGCLGTTSRTMLWKMGFEHWRLLRFMRWVKPGPFLGYLRALQRDQPLSYACSQCSELHHLDGDEHTPPYGPYQRTIRDGRDGQHRRLLLGGGVRFCVYSYHIEKTIALHQNSRPLDLMCNSITNSWMGPSVIGTLIFHTEARVVANHLLLRTQQFVNLGPYPPQGSRDWLVQQKVKEAVCPHFVACCAKLGDKIYDWKWMGLFHGDWCQCHEIDAICLCPSCPTEVRVDCVVRLPHRHILAVTQWKDMGDITMPEDQIWRAHSTEHEDNSMATPEFREWEWTIQRRDLTGIRQRFENHPSLRATDVRATNLLRRNLDMLRQMIRLQGLHLAPPILQPHTRPTTLQTLRMLMNLGFN